MDTNSSLALNRVQKYVIFAISLGNILEWYDIYLYIFWAPILSNLFFGENSESIRLFNTISLFALGFILRPLGGVFFGHLGDRIGRRRAFILSMVCMAIPTFIMGFIPIYSQIGIFAPILLAILRIAQTFPSGGELPGAFCYLYENASPRNKKFMSSFAGVGNQIGIGLAALECYFLKNSFSEETLTHWGWRISFIVGGLIGLGGFFLRYKLHETKLFQEMVTHHRMIRASIFSIFREHWLGILRGVFFGATQTTSFHFISVLFPIFFFHIFGINESQGLIATLVLLAILTIPLPIYGLLAEKYDVKYLVIGSCLLMLSLLYPLYSAIQSFSSYAVLVIGIFALCLTCLTALWPYFLSHLFPTRVRYTCVGLSFNICDGGIGGLSSLFILYLFSVKKDLTAFVWIALISCLLSIISCMKIKTVKE